MRPQEKIKIILADRDKAYMDKVKFCLESTKKVEIVAMVDNGEILLQKLEELQPDVLLTDIVLSGNDGLWVLEQLNEKGLSIKAKVMVSVMDSDVVVRKAMSLGADYFLAKPVLATILLERIEGILSDLSLEQNLIQSDTLNQEAEGMVENVSIKCSDLEVEISNILNRMGIPASIKGYHYIRKAVMMAVEDQEALIGITKRLYPDIAKYYKTTASKVERAIRHAIESSWKRSGESVYSEYSGFCPQNKPTNGQFIAALSEYLRLHLNRDRKRTA